MPVYFYVFLINNFVRIFNIQNTFKSNVVGTTVMTTYNNETYRIDDIDENATPSSEFTKKDGSKMTYMQYYKEVRISHQLKRINYLNTI